MPDKADAGANAVSAFLVLAAGAAPVVVDTATTLGDFLVAFGGGIVGGVVLASVAPARERVDQITAVILSGLIGTILGPVLARFAVAKFDWLPGYDHFVNNAAGGFVAGSFTPILFGLVYAASIAARTNPTGLIDWLHKFGKALPTIRIGFGKRSDD